MLFKWLLAKSHLKKKNTPTHRKVTSPWDLCPGKSTKSLLSWDPLHKHTWFNHSKVSIHCVLHSHLSLRKIMASVVEWGWGRDTTKIDQFNQPVKKTVKLHDEIWEKANPNTTIGCWSTCVFIGDICAKPRMYRHGTPWLIAIPHAVGRTEC